MQGPGAEVGLGVVWGSVRAPFSGIRNLVRWVPHVVLPPDLRPPSVNGEERSKFLIGN